MIKDVDAEILEQRGLDLELLVSKAAPSMVVKGEIGS
jgi:hypothetical protein